MARITISGNIIHFVICIALIVLGPIGYWDIGVAELDGGVMGLLMLYLFGIPLTYNEMPLSLACVFPEEINLVTWFIGVGFFFYF